MFGKKPGDLLLEKYHRGGLDRATKQVIERMLAEGVSEADIRRWHNMSESSRQQTKQIMLTAKGAMFLAEKNRTGDERAAIDFASRNYPCYGVPDEPDDEPHRGDDRPLPIYMYWRVDSWWIKNGFKAGAHARIEIARKQHATINSFIRAEMGAGRL